MVRRSKFNEIGLIMDKKNLFFTMDFNHQNILTHALNNQSSMSIEIIMNHINKQENSYQNYFTIMLAFEKILEEEQGSLLNQFFNDEDGGTSLRQVVEDPRLNTNQCIIIKKYITWDYTKSDDQIIDHFLESISEADQEEQRGEQDDERLGEDDHEHKMCKVTYSHVDFRPL